MKSNFQILIFGFPLIVGIYDHDTVYDTYIDILKIPELVARKMKPSLELGGGTNLHDLIEIMEGLAKENPTDYFYGKQFGIHLRKVIILRGIYILMKLYGLF